MIVNDSPSKSSFLSKGKINFKVIAIIIGITVVFQIINEFIIPEDLGFLDPIEISISMTYVISAIVAFSLAKKYSGSKVFSRAYFVFGLGESFLVIGEIIWNYLDITGGVAYPSIADVFYFALYPCFIIHLVLNIRFFKREIQLQTKIGLIILPLLIIFVSSFFVYSEIGDMDFDFYYTMLFVSASAVVISLAILGASVFRHSYIASVWVILVIGICISSIADIWYYIAEIFGDYERTHPTVFLWFFSTLLMIYALTKHRKLV